MVENPCDHSKDLIGLGCAPVTNDELQDAREAIEEQRAEIHEFLESEGVVIDD